MNLSKRQIQILEAINNEVETKGYPPSVRELCKMVGLRSTSTVHLHLNTLERLGYIKKEKDCPRAISIKNNINNADKVEKRTFFSSCDNDLYKEGDILLPNKLSSSRNDIVMKCSSSSAHLSIYRNDILVLNTTTNIKINDIILVSIDNSDMIIERVKLIDKNKIHFENPNITNMFVDLDRIKVFGVVKSVIRSFTSN